MMGTMKMFAVCVQVLYLCLGALAAFFGFSARGTSNSRKYHALLVGDICIYPDSPANATGLLAGLVLLAAQILVIAICECSCCWNNKMQGKGLNATMVGLGCILGCLFTGKRHPRECLTTTRRFTLCGIIGALAGILESEYRTLQKEVAWVVSNLAAGSILHKRAVFNKGAVPLLLHLLASSAFDVKKEAAYALGNLCVTPRDQGAEGKPILEHLTVLVDRGCLMGFIALVKSPDLEAARLGL